jgi:hypothetical protein
LIFLFIHDVPPAERLVFESANPIARTAMQSTESGLFLSTQCMRRKSPTPQPSFDPVNPKVSRKYQSSGISGSPLKDCFAPCTDNWIVLRLPGNARHGISLIEQISLHRT